MFVITADQVDSRHRADIVDAVIARITERWGAVLPLPVDRTAGDEIQLMVRSGDDALAIVLELTRRGEWSVGSGFGTIATPLPANTREANGAAFVAARAAVDSAKRRDTRFALRGPDGDETLAADLEAIVDLVLAIRARRSEQGWQLYDLMSPGRTQAQAAHELGITPQAASKRARAATIRMELAAVPAIGRMLAAADARGGRKR